MNTELCPYRREDDKSAGCRAPQIRVLTKEEQTPTAPDAIRTLLARAQLTQQAAADYLGVTARAVRKYVSGENPIPYPSVVVLELLAQQRELDEGVSQGLADQLVSEDEPLLRELAK